MKILVIMMIAAIVSELTRSFLAKAACHSPPSSNENGRNIILKYASTLKLATLAFPTTVFLMLASPLFYSGSTSLKSPLITLSLMLLIALIGAVVMLEAFFKNVILNEKGIHLVSVFSEVEIFWDDIESVTYNHWLKIFTVRAWDGTQLRVNPSLSGIQFLESILWERVEIIKFRQALHGFRMREQGLG